MRRPGSFTVAFGLVTAVLSSLLTYHLLAHDQVHSINDLSGSTNRDPYAPSAPQDHFRDSLRNDTKYITAWFDVGWTNEAMSMGNLLYLALLTQRTPILPPFAPTHLPQDTPLAPFGEVFDVPRLSAALNTPILEWHQVKKREDGTPWDEIGCWAIWPTVQTEGWKAGEPRASWAADLLKIDISWNAAPKWTSMGNYNHAPFWKLARLGYSDGRREATKSRPLPSTQLGVRLPPDEQVLCFDFIYYVSADKFFEYRFDYSPGWNHVMKHARFTERVQRATDDALRATFGIAEGAPIPLYLALHARHGDFGLACGDEHLPHPCFMPVKVWADHVASLREQLGARGFDAEHLPVVMTSDEKNSTFWDEVNAQGWHRIDHSKLGTKERLGLWYEVWIDVVVQSSAIGFLGSKESTMSLLAIRRVEDWYGGIGKMVHWDPRAATPSKEPTSLDETWLDE